MTHLSRLRYSFTALLPDNMSVAPNSVRSFSLGSVLCSAFGICHLESLKACSLCLNLLLGGVDAAGFAWNSHLNLSSLSLKSVCFVICLVFGRVIIGTYWLGLKIKTDCLLNDCFLYIT